MELTRLVSTKLKGIQFQDTPLAIRHDDTRWRRSLAAGGVGTLACAVCHEFLTALSHPGEVGFLSDREVDGLPCTMSCVGMSIGEEIWHQVVWNHWHIQSFASSKLHVSAQQSVVHD